MEFVRSEKGAGKLTRRGSIYVYQKDLAGGVTSWECELRGRGQCKARVKLDSNDEFLQEVNDHIHPLLKYKKKSRNFFRHATTNHHWRIEGDFRNCRGESATDEQHKKKY